MLQTDKTQAKKVSAKKQATTAQSSKTSDKEVTSQCKKVIPEQRLQMINEAAYYLAESRGFIGADSMDDWLAAEAEVDKQLSQGMR